MLFFTRWKAAAILLTALVVCLFAVPNFFSESTVRSWPSWAQRHIVLGLDLQGGSSLLLEVDYQRGAQGAAAGARRRRAAHPAPGTHSVHRPRHPRQRRRGAHHPRHRCRERARQAARTVAAAVRHPRHVGTAQRRYCRKRRPHYAHAIGRGDYRARSARPSISRSRSSSAASTSLAWSSRPSSARASTASSSRCPACRIRRG